MNGGRRHNLGFHICNIARLFVIVLRSAVRRYFMTES
jgi:hypothetical protein